MSARYLSGIFAVLTMTYIPHVTSDDHRLDRMDYTVNIPGEPAYFTYTRKEDGALKISGCTAGQGRRPVDILVCLRAAKLDPVFDWASVESATCGLFTKEKVLIAFVDTDHCLKGKPSHYFWVGGSNPAQQCGVYTASGFFVGFAARELCGCKSGECTKGEGVLSESAVALSKDVWDRIIPEVLNLPDGAPIPPEILQNFDSRLIGASIVARIHNRREAHADIKEDYDFYHDTRIQMAFGNEYIDNIKKNCFLNQHQVGHTRGCLCPESRAEVENKFTGLMVEKQYGRNKKNPAHKVRPKYSYLVLTDPKEKIKTPVIEGYGDVFAVFKEEMKKRATFSPHDSLGSGAEAIHSFFYRSPDRLPGDWGGYWETQIWGEVCFSDVEYFIVNCFKELPDENLEKLKETGIPIYGCRKEDKDFNTFIEPGHLLYPGKSK